MAPVNQRADRRWARWAGVVALAVGLSLIGMHAGAACAGPDETAHGHHEVEQLALHAASVEVVDHAVGACLDCAPHGAMPVTVVCAVLLLVAAGGLGRLVRRLLGAFGWSAPAPRRGRSLRWRPVLLGFGRPPDLQLLQVMRC